MCKSRKVQNYKMFDSTKFKVSADDISKHNVPKIVISVFDWIKILWGKEKILLPISPPFLIMFSKGL